MYAILIFFLPVNNFPTRSLAQIFKGSTVLKGNFYLIHALRKPYFDFPCSIFNNIERTEKCTTITWFYYLRFCLFVVFQ